jgi:hypothetical protein
VIIIEKSRFIKLFTYLRCQHHWTYCLDTNEKELFRINEIFNRLYHFNYWISEENTFTTPAASTLTTPTVSTSTTSTITISTS